MKIFIILYILFKTNIFANPLNEILSLVEPQTNCLEDIGVGDQEIEQSPADQTLYKKCIEDICQNGPSLSSNLEQLEEDFNKDSDTFLKQNLDPLIDNIFSNAQDRALNAIDNLSDEEKETVESIWYSGLMANIVLSKSGDMYNAYLEGVRNAPEGLSTEEQIAFGDNAANEYLAREFSPEFAQSFTSMKSIQEEIEQYITVNQNQIINDIQNATPASLRERIYRIPNSLEAGKQTLLSAINRYEISTEARESNDSLTGSMNNLMEPIAELVRLEAISNNRNYSEQLNIAIEAFKKLPSEKRNNFTFNATQNIRTNIQYQRNNCRSRISNELSQLQEQASLTNSRSQVEVAKQEFITNLSQSNLYSKKTRTALKEYLNSLIILTPPSRESYIENLQEFNERNQKIFNNTTPFSQVVSGINISGGFQCSNLPQADSLNSFRHGGQLVNHQIVLGNDALLNFEQVGKSVLFHELSHAVSAFIRNGSGSRTSKFELNRSRRCTGRGHIQGSFFQRMLKPSVSNFQEEDFADVLTAKMFPNTRNIACGFMNGNLPTSMAVNATTSTIADPMMQLMGMEPTHSSDVYRLLNWQYNTGKSIPSSCNQAMREENLQNEFPTRCIRGSVNQ